jgi:hypothetical protein
MHPSSSLLRTSLLLLAFAALTACGSVSKMTKEKADAPVRLADFNRIEVLDFNSTDTTKFEDPAKAADQAAKLQAAQKTFADMIAEEIRLTGAFPEVVRDPGQGQALRISGEISRFDDGNIVARGLTGFAGQTHFDARVDLMDAQSGKVLASVTIDRNSWPLPVGASMSTLQTTNFFMNNAAKQIATQLANKKKEQAAAQ